MGIVNLGVGGRVKLGPSLSNAQPATIVQTAYGAGGAATTSSVAGVQTWHLAVAVPVLAVGWLAFLRWSLPK